MRIRVICEQEDLLHLTEVRTGTSELNNSTIREHDNAFSLFDFRVVSSFDSVTLSILIIAISSTDTPDLDTSFDQTFAPFEAYAPPAPA